MLQILKNTRHLNLQAGFDVQVTFPTPESQI